MNSINRSCWRMAATLAALGLFAWVGCENDPSTLDTLDPYFSSNPYTATPRTDLNLPLLVEPTDASVKSAGDLIAYRAKGGTPPFTWTVANPQTGTITPSAISTDYAVYKAKSPAANTVVATDASGRSAVAAVGSGALGFTVIPATVTLTQPKVGDTVQFRAAGGTPPYGQWRANIAALGTIDSHGLYTVTSASAQGDNTVSITDSAGAVATATVTHQLQAQALAIVPSTAELLSDGETGYFFASGGVPDYVWTVTYPSRGKILSTSADTATIEYQRLSSGNNTISVTDAAGSTATFTVTQTEAPPPQISPSSVTLAAPTNNVVFTVSGGTAPYAWSVITAGGGSVSPTTGPQTIYTRGGAPGNYVVRVTDSRSQFGLATVTQH